MTSHLTPTPKTSLPTAQVQVEAELQIQSRFPVRLPCYFERSELAFSSAEKCRADCPRAAYPRAQGVCSVWGGVLLLVFETQKKE